jgi:hypothetical protein
MQQIKIRKLVRPYKVVKYQATKDWQGKNWFLFYMSSLLNNAR